MAVADGKVWVLIATTNGPVEVLLLTEEDPVIGRCVACIGGTTETADIAAEERRVFVETPWMRTSRGAATYRKREATV
jgi:hypothetical protein